jgi:crossover junction endodeoxyribonuclease RuvC
MIILGIDPGTAATGYGIIQGSVRKIKCVSYGCIPTDPAFSPGERLKKLAFELSKLIKKYQPKIVAVENIYFFKNLKTALPVSQAKGVILLVCAQKRVPVYEFTPLQAKMAVVGYGRAEKNQVQKMLKILLGLKETPKPDDAADALAIAICAYLLKKNNFAD